MKKAILAVSILTLFGSSGWTAFTPSENGVGIRWVSASAESWSGSAQTHSDGGILHLAGAFDTSIDATNGAGVTVFLGLLDPIMELAQITPTPTGTLVITPTITPGEPTLTFTPTNTPGGPTQTFTPTNTPGGPTQTFTPTNTAGGPTQTFSPTITPGGPSLTPTLCIAALLDADFNLDGVDGIDSRDLLLLYAALKDRLGNPYDFDCDGTTGILDLIRFSQKWKVDIP
jgi:hypothetical protein